MNFNWIDSIGFMAAIGTTIAQVPQVYKVFKSKQTHDISLYMYIISTIGVALWLIYGILKKDFPLILANAVTFILVTTVLIYKLKYK